jgi:hypothetical protein
VGIIKKYGKILAVMAILLGLSLAAMTAQAQSRDFSFHWSPSPVLDRDGNTRPPAVEYEVYLSRDGGFDEHIATVVGDTTYTLTANPGIIHRIRVTGVDAAGNTSPFSEWSDPIYFEGETRQTIVPPAAALQQNYPNPFNPETRLVYGIPEDVSDGDPVRLDIFSIDGRLVRTMEVDRTPGWHEAVWDGTDNRGRTQATGLYVQRLVVGAMVETQKMTMVK